MGHSDMEQVSSPDRCNGQDSVSPALPRCGRQHSTTALAPIAATCVHMTTVAASASRERIQGTLSLILAHRSGPVKLAVVMKLAFSVAGTQLVLLGLERSRLLLRDARRSSRVDPRSVSVQSDRGAGGTPGRVRGMLSDGGVHAQEPVQQHADESADP